MNARKTFKESEKGLATLEALPLMAIFVILIGYGLGMWGYVHAGILNSIAARTYAFETFRNRTDLSYFRINGNGLYNAKHYDFKQVRWHGISSINQPTEEIFAPKKPIAVGFEVERKTASPQTHTEKVMNLGNRRNANISVSPAWLMIGYGMCVDYRCGGDLQ